MSRIRVVLLKVLPLAILVAPGCAPSSEDPASPNAVLTAVQLTPATVSLATSATQQFTVSGQWSNGATTAPAVNYSATGGTISVTGLFTAGATAGTLRVIAVQQAGTLADTATGTITAPTLQAVVLTPPSVSLAAGATQQFAVSGQWSNGATTAPAVTYSATGGTVSAAGLYTAGATAGTFRVIAVQQGGTLADTAAVTITPAVLQAVILTPASVSLATGATQQYAVSGQWSNGATTPPSVTYSATGGTISAGALYTAGATAGTFRVIAVQQGGTLADTSVVTITASAPGLANECTSPQAGWIWCDDFDLDRTATYFEYDNAAGDFTRVTGVGNDGSFGMRARWSAGEVGAGSLHLAIGKTPQAYFRSADAGTANYRELYWRVYLRNQPGWTGGGGDKLSRAFVFASTTTWAQAMIAHVWSGNDNSADENILTLDPARGTDAAGNLVTTDYNDFAHLTFLGLTKGTNAIFSAAKVGTWHCIEARARLNDAGLSNGVTELWIDGVLDASKSGLNFLGSFNAYGLNAVYLENFWNLGSPVAQERYFDNFVVSTQRIGC